MSEENAAAQGADSGSGTPDTNSQGDTAQHASSFDASSAAKLQNSNGQVSTESSTEGTPSKEEGDSNKADAKADSKDSGKDSNIPAWDPNEQSWLESKGIDVGGLDPKSPAAKALIKNAREAESQMSRIANEQKAREVAAAAKNVKDPAVESNKPERKTEIEKFESYHSTIVENACYALGVSDMDTLAAQYPDYHARLENIYIKERQKAWEREQSEVARLNEENGKIEADKVRFKTEIETASKAMGENITSLKAGDPDIEKNLKDSGANDILAKIESDAAWPVAFVMSNPKIAKWFGKAAKAIQVVADMDGLKDNIRKDYEKELKQQKEASLTPGNENSAGSEKARIASSLQRTSYSNGF